jgi:hypothetical protein
MEIQIHPEHLMATKQAKSRNRHQTFLDKQKNNCSYRFASFFISAS